MFSDKGIEIKVTESSHPYDDPVWYKRMLKWPKEEKIKAAKDIADKLKFSSISGTMNLVGISPKVAYIMVDGSSSENSFLWVHCFSMTTLVLWNKNPSSLSDLMTFDIRHYCDWFENVQEASESERSKAVQKIVDYVSTKNPDLIKRINKGELKLIGFTPRLDYLNLEGRMDRKKCFPIPTLLYWDKKNRVLVVFNMQICEPILISNPVLRYDDTILNEVNGTREAIKGITG